MVIVINNEMAYLLGMITGNGEIQRGVTTTTITIEVPHKKLETEFQKEVGIYVKASITDIREILEPLMGTSLKFIQNTNVSILSFTKPNEDYLMREIMGYIGNANGFMGIMQNKELWATSTRFLNDKNEYIEGLLLAQKIAGDYSKTCADKEKKFLNSFQRMIQDRIDKGCNQDIYSISFCECGDLLSQWRGYGKQGGVSLGFDLTYYEMEYDGQKALGIYNFMDRFHYENSSDEKKEADEFMPSDGEFMIKLWKVIYEEKEQRRILDDLINVGIEAVRQEMCWGGEERLVEDILYSLDYLLPIFKNKSFEEEKEVRYVWRNDGSRKIYFRERNRMIVPYIRCMVRDCNCRELEKFPIKDIIVGPQAKQQELIDGVKYFLQYNGYEYLIDKVRGSEIPYRE